MGKIKAERAQRHEDWKKRQAEREARAASGENIDRRKFDKPDRGERRDNGERNDRRGERRDFDRRDGNKRFDRDYRDRAYDRDRTPDTSNLSLEEKLALLAG